MNNLQSDKFRELRDELFDYNNSHTNLVYGKNKQYIINRLMSENFIMNHIISSKSDLLNILEKYKDEMEMKNLVNDYKVVKFKKELELILNDTLSNKLRHKIDINKPLVQIFLFNNTSDKLTFVLRFKYYGIMRLENEAELQDKKNKEDEDNYILNFNFYTEPSYQSLRFLPDKCTQFDLTFYNKKIKTAEGINVLKLDFEYSKSVVNTFINSLKDSVKCNEDIIKYFDFYLKKSYDFEKVYKEYIAIVPNKLQFNLLLDAQDFLQPL